MRALGDAARRARAHATAVRTGSARNAQIDAIRIGALFAMFGSFTVTSCSHEATPAETSQSSTIALDAPTNRLWITSPDDGALVAIDAETLEERSRILLGGEPEQLLLVDGLVAVTLGRASSVALVDATSGAVRHVTVPCASTRGLARLSDDALLVTCPLDDRVVEIDLRSAIVRRVLHAPGSPTSIARAGGTVFLTASRTGLLRSFSVGEWFALPLAVISDAPPVLELDGLAVSTRALETRSGIAATQLDAIAGDPLGGPAVTAYQRVDHDSARGRDPARGGYGSVVDGAPRIEPLLTGSCGMRYARFDGGARVFSGPSAVGFGGDGAWLWVAHRATDNVALIACDEAARDGGAGAEADVVATFRTGRGPRGLAVSADGRTAYVDVGFDAAVAVLAWDGVRGGVRTATRALRRTLGPDVMLSAPARRGRALFYDAVDTHLTPSGVVTCGTCHPGGGEDGLSWFLHTNGIARKLRRTPPAWGARPSLAPHHFDGEFTDARTLTQTTIVELMEGDALLVDLDAIAAYMAELSPPPVRPRDGAERTRIARGAALFASPEVGCATCHVGDLLGGTRAFDVLPATADADATISAVQVPPLVGVHTRPPYLHDGRAASLRDVLVTHNVADRHGHTSMLGDDELAALVAYLESL